MKAAFICPLYDMKNHFDLAFNLYKSMINLRINESIYYIFSNVPQKNKFAMRIKEAFGREINYLILPENQLDFKSKVVVKKMYALRQLMHDYDYLCLIDSESIFIRKTDFAKLFENIWNSNGCLNANVSPDGFGIMRTCFRTLSVSLYNNSTIRQEFGYFKYNIWFNEIPVYKCSTLPNFFKWLDTFDENGWKNQWNCFEYYIYAAYLVLYENRHIKKHKDIISNGGVMEYLFERPEEEQYKILEKLGTHWTSSSKCVTDNVYLQFHIDRETGDGHYSYGLSNESVRKKNKERIKLLIKDFMLDYNILGIKRLSGLKLKVENFIQGRN